MMMTMVIIVMPVSFHCFFGNISESNLHILQFLQPQIKAISALAALLICCTGVPAGDTTATSQSGPKLHGWLNQSMLKHKHLEIEHLEHQHCKTL
jgi:hypothetical protein